MTAAAAPQASAAPRSFSQALLRPSLPELWTFLAVALPTLGALLAPMPAVDLAYQIRAGGEILDGLGIPRADTWTHTIQGLPWLDQQWAAQAILALVYRLGGWTGLAILRGGLVALTFGLLLLVVRRRSPQMGERTVALFVVGAFAVAANALALRPQLLVAPLFVATLLLLTQRYTHPRRLWLIPVFAALWANLHGSFPLVIVLCGLAWLADATNRKRGPTMLAVTVASAAATFLNPLGWDAWVYVVRLTTNPTIGSRVSEWRAPGLTDLPGILFWLSAAIVVAFLGWRFARRVQARQRGELPTGWSHLLPLPPPALLTLLIFGGLAASTGRGLAWWPLAAVFVLAGFAPLRRRDRRHAGGPERRSPLNAIIAAAIVVAGVALLPIWRPVGAAGVPLGALKYAPQGIAAELARITAPRVVNCGVCRLQPTWVPQRWGSWLELAVPHVAPAVDSRIELFPQRVWEDYDAVAGGAIQWASILERYDVDLVVTEAGQQSGLEAVLGASSDWSRVYTDADGSIWQRAGS